MQVPHFGGIPVFKFVPDLHVGRSVRSGLDKAAQWIENRVGHGGGGPAGPSQARAGAAADQTAPTSAADVAHAWNEVTSAIGRTTSTFP